MHLYRTAYEAIIEAPIDEIRALCTNLSRLQTNETRVFDALPRSQDIEGAEVGSKLVVTVDQGLFRASWNSETDLIICGNPQSIQAFAEACDFQCEPIAGIHTHWDFDACSTLVHPKSLPVVVQLS